MRGIYTEADHAAGRGWPVNPTKYPLTGPSKGEVYAGGYRHPLTWRDYVGSAALVLFAFGVVVYVAIQSTNALLHWNL